MEQYNPCIACRSPIMCKHCKLTHIMQAVQDRIAERDTLKAENALMGNLICYIHGDGGHYITEHGMEKAVNDAIDIWVNMKLATKALKGGSDG